MPRPARIEFPGALYHVTSRGNWRQSVFFDDSDRTRFISRLKDNLETYDVVLHAYVLMPNHYHLLVHTKQANLSRFVQRLNTSYALYARYKHRQPGHQFEGRYKAKVVQGDEYIVRLTRYIHLNPVRMAACEGMSEERLKEKLEAYMWSSYQGYVRKRSREDFVNYEVLGLFGREPAIARSRYKGYVLACLVDNDEPLMEALKASQYAVGDDDFLEDMNELLREKRTGRPQDRDIALPKEEVGIDLIDRIVAKEFSIEPELLTAHGNRAGVAKVVATELANRFTGMNQRGIGVHYGNISSAAVSAMRRKVREDEKGELRELVAKLAPRVHKQMAEAYKFEI